MVENPNNPDLIHLLSVALEWAADLDGAADVLEAHEDVAEGAVTRLTRAAELRRKSGKPVLAEGLARRAAALPGDDGHRATALAELARALLAQERSVAAIRALEEAVTVNPVNTTIRFDLAYQYSQRRLAPMAVHHDRQLLNLAPDSAMALNNPGVELGRLDMPFRSFDCYAASARLGETLAGANLANEFIGIGAREQAKAFLDAARQQESPHANVFEADAAIERSLRQEAEREEGVTALAPHVRDLFRQLSDDETLPTGEWLIAGVGIVNLDCDENSARGRTDEGTGRVIVQVEPTEGALMLTLKTGEYGLSTDTGWGGWRTADELAFVVRQSSGSMNLVTFKRPTT